MRCERWRIYSGVTMAGNLQTISLGVQDSLGVPAPSKISANTRVKGTLDFIGTVADTVVFSSPTSVTGQWTIPDQRTMVNFIPTISQSSTGISINPVIGTIGPMLVVQPDAKMQNG